MSTKGHYLGVFLSNRSSAKWRGWYGLSEDEQKVVDAVGLPALAAWDEAHRDVRLLRFILGGGPLGPTKRVSGSGVADAVNEMTVFVVVRAESHEAAARLFEGYPHMTIYPCDCVDVMPLLGG